MRNKSLTQKNGRKSNRVENKSDFLIFMVSLKGEVRGFSGCQLKLLICNGKFVSPCRWKLLVAYSIRTNQTGKDTTCERD